MAHPDETMSYVRRHAQEMDEDVMRQHIDLYVNDYSLDVGEEGSRAVHKLLDRGEQSGTAPLFPQSQESVRE